MPNIQSVSPIRGGQQIVDKNGGPTPAFIRAFNQHFPNVQVVYATATAAAAAAAGAQPGDNDLTAISALTGTGIAVRTAADTWATRTLTAPAAGLSITNPAGIAGNPTFALSNDLAALEGLSSTGFAVRTTTDTWAQRTLTAGTGISISNGDGVSGNPVITCTVTGGTGTVTTTGSPASGNLAKFSGATSIVNGDLSGDVTTSGTLVTTLAASGVTAGTYGDSTHVARITVDAKGRVTAASNVAVSGGGGGGWSLVASNTISSSVASVDFTALSGNDIMIVCRNVTQAISGVVTCRVSVDNGVTFYATSGDYVVLSTAGVESSTTTGPGFHSTNATAARSGVVQIIGAGMSSVPKPMTSALSPGDTRLFLASTSAINAVRVLGTAGNLTGGNIYVFTR